MEKQKLKIKYQIPEKLDEKMDRELGKVLKKYGWKFEGSGFNHEIGERDLGFYKVSTKQTK